MSFTLRVRNFRGLRRVDWSPRGVCAVVGPNGSGKTTLIDVLELLRHTYERGFARAIAVHGGLTLLKTRGVAAEDPVALELLVKDVRWIFQPEAFGADASAGFEKVTVGEEVVLDVSSAGAPESLSAARLTGGLPSLRQLVDSGGVNTRKVYGLVGLLAGSRLHRHYALSELRETGSRAGMDTNLSSTGTNVFTVLANWNNVARERSSRFEFVMRWMRASLPNDFQDLDLVSVAGIVAGQIITPAFSDPVPMSLTSDGLLVLLLHLTAIASTDKGGVVAIDEPENALHPFAIHRLVEAAREWSAANDVTVLFATHSPVLLDCFKDRPGQIYVMEPGARDLPVALDQLRKPEWLAHFSFGDLYEKLEFGAPVGAEDV